MHFETSGNQKDRVAQNRIYDERIAYHQECIRGLNEEKNKLNPLSRLPPEILATIFSFVVAGFKHNPKTLKDFPFPLYYFTHVSRSWRSVGLATPLLWRIIIPTIGRCALTIAMLDRSKAVDLIILSRHNSPATESFLKLVLTKHASRVRELVIDMKSSLVALFEDLQRSSLRLHSLRLDSPLRLGRVTFPTAVLETDSLRRLDVRNCEGPWFSMSLPALTTLKIYKLHHRPLLSEFLELLRRIATLQVLDMADSLPLAIDPDRDTHLMDPIHLPSLQYLSVFDDKGSFKYPIPHYRPADSVSQICLANQEIRRKYHR